MENVVLITGASRGIGRAAALLFARRGDIVVANYRQSADAAASLLAELQALNPRSFVYRADVSVESEVAELFRVVYKTFPKVDVLVNNAGVAEELLLSDMSAVRFQTMLQRDLMPVFYTTKEYCVRQTLHENPGSIVNVTSIYGADGGAMESHYSAAKAGVIGFTKAIAKEYAYMGIRCNAVAPGAIATDMTLKHSAETIDLLRGEIPLGRLGSPEEVAEAIAYLADARYVTGEVLRVSGGL